MNVKLLAAAVFAALILLVSGCSRYGSEHIQGHVDKADNGVDIWTSLQFEIINDINIIKKIDPSSLKKLEKPVMLDVLIKIKNTGKQNARNINITANEPTPLTYLSSTGSGPIRPDLNSGKETEMHYTVTFSEKELVDDFISKLQFVVSWEEDGEGKEVYIKITN